jgi:hypothetical protein
MASQKAKDLETSVSCLAPVGESLYVAGSLGHPWLMSLYIATNRLRTTGDEMLRRATSKPRHRPFLCSTLLLRERERLLHGILDDMLRARKLDYSFWSSFNDPQHRLDSVEIPTSLLNSDRIPFHQTDTGATVLCVCICFYWSYAWLIPKSRWVSRWIETASFFFFFLLLQAHTSVYYIDDVSHSMCWANPLDFLFPSPFFSLCNIITC